MLTGDITHFGIPYCLHPEKKKKCHKGILQMYHQVKMLYDTYCCSYLLYQDVIQPLRVQDIIKDLYWVIYPTIIRSLVQSMESWECVKCYSSVSFSLVKLNLV